MQVEGVDRVLQQQQIERAEQQQRASVPYLYPSAPTEARDRLHTHKQSLDGRLVLKAFKDPASGKPRKYWGRLHYLGELKRPYYFRVMYEDGDSESASVKAIQRHLMPMDTQLPAGITIPTHKPDSSAVAALLQRQDCDFTTSVDSIIRCRC